MFTYIVTLNTANSGSKEGKKQKNKTILELKSFEPHKQALAFPITVH